MSELNPEQVRELLRTSKVGVWRALLMTYRMIYTLLDSELGKKGLSLPRLQMLLVLYTEGPMVPVRLANRLLVTRGNISTLIKRMLAEELIEASADHGTPSRPAYKLSKKGEEQFLEVIALHVKNVDRIMPDESAGMLDQLVDVQELIWERFHIGVPLGK